MECMGRTVVDFCLFGSECGGGRMTSWKESLSEESVFEPQETSHPES